MAFSFNSLLSFAMLAGVVSAGTYSGHFVAPPARNSTTITRRGPDGLINMGYFVNWGTFKATDIPIETLTHVLYAFGDSDKASGALKLSDANADTGGATEGELGGHLGEFIKLKQKRRNLKVLMSIGGWTYSQAGHFDFVVDATARSKFVSDSIKFIEDYGLDGIDIDYEALTDAQSKGYVALLKELREALDKHAADKADKVPYLLTSAVGFSPAPYVAEAAKYMDLWNIMDYDFSGSWLKTTAHQANLFPDGTENGGVSVDTGMQKWMAVVEPKKIVMGQPLYARAFKGTKGIGQPFDGVAGTEGIMAYKDLPASGPTVHEDLKLGASYNLDGDVLASYDTPGVTKVKAKYIQDKGLAGAMWWDLSTDKVGEDSLVGITAKEFKNLDQSKNHLNYPKSVYSNVRAAGSADEGGSGGGQVPEPPSTTEPPSTATSSEPTKPTKTCKASNKKRSTA